MEQFAFNLVSKRSDVNTLVPPYLDSKVHARDSLMIMVDQRTQVAMLLATYQDMGTFVLYDFESKKQHKVNRKNPLKSIKFFLPYIISVHEDAQKKAAPTVELYDVSSSKSIQLKLPNEDFATAAFVDGERAVVVGKSSLYKSTRMQSSDGEPGLSLVKSSSSVPDSGSGIPSQLTRIALVGDEPILQGITPRLSHLRGQYLALVSARQVQVWDVETGRLVHSAKPKSANATFLLCSADKAGSYVVVTTSDEMTIIRPGKTGSTTVPTPTPVTSLDMDADTLITGNLDGVISTYSLSTGRFLNNITQAGATAGKGRSLMTQIGAKVNFTVCIAEVLVAGMDTGDITMWRRDTPDQTDPLTKASLRGKPLIVAPLEKTVYFLVNKKEKKSEEVVMLPIRARRLRMLAERHAMLRKGTTSASSAASDAEEVMKSGSLNIKLANDKSKGKTRFCILRGNGVLYVYRSEGDNIPLETFMLKHKSTVQAVKGKRNQIQVTLNSNAEPLRLTAESDDEAAQWLDALLSTVRELGFQDVFEVDYSEIQFEKTPSGELLSVGKGGSSNVVRGLYAGREVAVKLFKNMRTSTDALRNEIMLVNAVKHPNILPIIGITKPPNVAVIMPYMENGSLFDALHGDSSTKLDSSKWTWQLFVKVADDVARALEYLHNFRMNGTKQAIIHSDLKSANLLVKQLDPRCSLPSVLLIDFGISVQNDPDSSKRQGTVCYMAPELLKTGGKITPKVDVFAYGVLLAEIISQKIPFFKVPPKQIEAAVLAGERMPLPADIPEALKNLITACWAQNPADRPTISEVRQGLCEVGAELIVSNMYRDPINNSSSGSSSARLRRATATTPTSKSVRLYDRRREVTKILRILQTFNRSVTGSETIFITSHSGYGKSALLNRVADFSSISGWVALGKFVKDDKTPYSAMQKALRELMTQALVWWGTDQKLEIRNRLLFAFDEAGIAAICSFIPEFMQILERSEEWVEKTMKNVSAEKFLSAAVRMFRLMAGDGQQPLLLCLDDLQWADQASLNLLARLMSESSSSDKSGSGQKRQELQGPANIVVIGSYRDNEVDEKHPFLKLFRSKLDPSHVAEIALKQLQLKDVVELLEETFPTFDRKKIDSLAPVVLDRSFGVPFFIQQFVQNMSSRQQSGSDSALSLDALASTSEEDIVSSNLGDLSSEQRIVLLIGSLISGNFTAKLIGRVLRHLSISTQAKFGSVNITYLEKADTSSPLTKRENSQAQVDELVKRGLLLLKGKTSVTFAHEQVREAISQKIFDDKQRKLLHVEIARALLYSLKSSSGPTSGPSRIRLFDSGKQQQQASSDSPSDSPAIKKRKSRSSFDVDTFEIARHFSEGVDLLKSDAESCEVTSLLIYAAEQAQKMADHTTALEFCQVAIRLLTHMGAIKPGDFSNFNLNVCDSVAPGVIKKLIWDVAIAQAGSGFAAMAADPLYVSEAILQALAETPLENGHLSLVRMYKNAIKWNLQQVIMSWMEATLALGFRSEKNITPEALVSTTSAADKLWEEVSALLNGDPTRLLKREAVTTPASPEAELAQRLCMQTSNMVSLVGLPGMVGYFVLVWIRGLLKNPGLTLPAEAVLSFAIYLANQRSDYDSALKLWSASYKILKTDKTALFRSWSWERLIENYFPRVKSWPKVQKLLTEGIQLAEEENLHVALQYLYNLQPAIQAMTDTLDNTIQSYLRRAEIHKDNPNEALISSLWLGHYRRLRGDSNIADIDKSKFQGTDLVMNYAIVAIGAMTNGMLQNYDEVVKAMIDIQALKIRAKAGEIETLLFDIGCCMAALYKLRTEQDEATRTKLQSLLAIHKSVILGWDRGSNNLAPMVKLVEADEEYSQIAFNLLTEQQEMNEATALQLIVRYSEALRENDHTNYVGPYAWAAGLACERCAEIASLMSFDTLRTFMASEALKRYETFGSKPLASRVRSLYLLRTGSSSSSLSPTASSPVYTGGSTNPLSRQVSSVGTGTVVVGDEASGQAMPHLALARTFSRGLQRFWLHHRDIIPTDEHNSNEFKSFLSNLNHFSAYMSQATHFVDEALGMDTSATSTGHHPDSPLHTNDSSYLFAVSTSDGEDGNLSGSDHSRAGSMASSSSPRPQSTSSHPMRLADLVEAVAASASYFVQPGHPSISCFIPPTGLPSYINNGSQLQQLLSHVVMSFLTYFNNGPHHLLVFAERQSASNFLLRFQITDFAPSSLEKLSVEVSNDHQQSIIIAHHALAANIKFAEHIIDHLEAEVQFSALPDRRAAIVVSVPVTSAPVIAVHVSSTNAFQQELTAKTPQLHVVIVDADGATTSFIGSLKSQISSGGLKIIVVGSKLPPGVLQTTGQVAEGEAQVVLIHPSMVRSELQRHLADLH